MSNVDLELQKIILSLTINRTGFEFTVQTDLIDDLGFDSLQLISMVVLIEEHFDFVFPDDFLSLENLRNYKEIVNILSGSL